jgi:hypothetical protein
MQPTWHQPSLRSHSLSLSRCSISQTSIFPFRSSISVCVGGAFCAVCVMRSVRIVLLATPMATVSGTGDCWSTVFFLVHASPVRSSEVIADDAQLQGNARTAARPGIEGIHLGRSSSTPASSGRGSALWPASAVSASDEHERWICMQSDSTGSSSGSNMGGLPAASSPACVFNIPGPAAPPSSAAPAWCGGGSAPPERAFCSPVDCGVRRFSRSTGPDGLDGISRDRQPRSSLIRLYRAPADSLNVFILQ